MADRCWLVYNAFLWRKPIVATQWIFSNDLCDQWLNYRERHIKEYNWTKACQRLVSPGYVVGGGKHPCRGAIHCGDPLRCSLDTLFVGRSRTSWSDWRHHESVPAVAMQSAWAQGRRQVNKCGVDTFCDRNARAYDGGLGRAPSVVRGKAARNPFSFWMPNKYSTFFSFSSVFFGLAIQAPNVTDSLTLRKNSLRLNQSPVGLSARASPGK